MNFTLRQLQAFVAVAHLGSFTRAASALHVSQPALTVQIRQLEEALGIRLFDRSTRSVALSQVGRQFVPTLERILSEITAFEADARELTSTRRGLVTVATLPSIASALLPAAIARFKADHPGITVRIRDALAASVMNMVRAREVDFGVGSPTGLDPEIRTTPLFSERMSVFFLPEHPIGRRARVRLKSISRFPVIVLDRGSSVRVLVDRAFESIGHPITPAYEATYVSTALGLVKAGLGIAILPSPTALDTGIAGLKTRLIEHDKLTRHISIIQTKGRSLSPAAEHFAETIQELCKARAV